MVGRAVWGIGLGVLAVVGGAVWFGVHKAEQQMRDIVGTSTLVRGSVWRITADYLYKGQPMTLDFAEICGSVVTRYGGGSRSYDPLSGPKVYGRKTFDGKVLAIIYGGAFCSLHENWPRGGLPENFLPLTVIFDDPDTLSSGVFYTSDEAYRNPSSDLKWLGGRVALLSSKDYLEYRKTAEPNAVRSLLNDWEGPETDLRAAYPGKRPSIAVSCFSFAKVKLTDGARALVREVWPESRPRYWNPGSDREMLALSQRVENKLREEGVDVSAYRLFAPTLSVVGGGGSMENAVVLHDGTMEVMEKYRVPPRYPGRLISTHRWNEAEKSWSPPEFRVNVETKDDRERGFSYCYSELGRLVEPWNSIKREFPDDPLAKANRNVWFSVDGTPVFYGASGTRRAIENHYKEYASFFENDEYLFLLDEGADIHSLGEQMGAETK